MCLNFHVVSEKGQMLFVLRQKSYGEVNKLLSFFLLALISCLGLEVDQLSHSTRRTDTTTFILVGMRCLC